MPMNTYKIAAIPADGIGPEVIAAGLQALRVCSNAATAASSSTSTNFDWGSDYYKKHGVMMPANGLEQLKQFDAIFFGAVGAPDVPGPHHALGPAPADLPGLRPVRQRAADPDPAGHHARRCATSARAISTG